MDSVISKSIVWTIAGSDSGGGAGIQADLATINDLGCHGCSVITALTVQNSVAVEQVEPVSVDLMLQQLNCLLKDLPPNAIKVGLLCNQAQINALANWLAIILNDYQTRHGGSIAVVVDPVMVASCGDALANGLDFSPLTGLITLFTPNSAELSVLMGTPLNTLSEVSLAATTLASTLGCNILAKGGDKGGLWHKDSAKDLYVCAEVDRVSARHQHRQFMLSSQRVDSRNHHGSGCSLSSAIAAAMAKGYVLHDAVVIAKAYVTAGIRDGYQLGDGPGPLARTGWPKSLEMFPSIASFDDGPSLQAASAFKKLDTSIGVYPVVSSIAVLESLLKAGAKTIQLRVKSVDDPLLEQKIQQAISLGETYQAQVFINDHWQLAITHGASGIHLGQEDLYHADLAVILQSGIALGVSSHGYFELLLAAQIKPSYIAVGHIFATTTKEMPSLPQGLDRLRHYAELLENHFPSVAIGGIDINNLAAVKATGVNNVAVVRAVSNALSPADAYRTLSQGWEAINVTE
ncbi:thiamine phosphate synthase [Shewanella colwelliana]|uniref:thiamine phosphate synthase n=1 Tax=Shewanella colwelliana TaxID=23 RepID=UPI003D0313E3